MKAAAGLSRRRFLRWALSLPLGAAAAAAGGVGYAVALLTCRRQTQNDT